MSDFCKIYCAGSVKAPYDWITHSPIGISRLIYINGGEGGYIINNEKIPCKKDHLYLLPYFVDTYSSYESDEKRFDHGYVNFEMIPPIISNEVFCLNPYKDSDTMVAVEVFKTLCKECSAKNDFPSLSPINQQYLRSTTIFLVDKIIEKFDCEVVKDKVIIKALRMMHENLDGHQTINHIAKECYLSTDGFIRRFKKVVGETPYSYLKKIRIFTAQNMRSAGISLNVIAEKCGYSDPCSLLHAMDGVLQNK